MSRAFALIKFNKTNNIYYGCYDGTSDILIPNICTPKECYDSELDAYTPISYLDSEQFEKQCEERDNINDWNKVEIYSDYGGGFWWVGLGSESLKIVKEGLDPWNENILINDGIPQWVQDFLSEKMGGFYGTYMYCKNLCRE